MGKEKKTSRATLENVYIEILLLDKSVGTLQLVHVGFSRILYLYDSTVYLLLLFYILTTSVCYFACDIYTRTEYIFFFNYPTDCLRKNDMN